MVVGFAPGVRHEWIDRAPDIDERTRTDVAAFVGLARRGPVGVAVAVESWRQFLAGFGDPVPGTHLGTSVRAFFENGGRRCRVVRAVGSGAAAAQANVAADGRWRVTASSVGEWGNDVQVRLVASRGALASVDPDGSGDSWLAVSTTVGFERGSLVQVRTVESPGTTTVPPPVRLVVNHVDPARSRLVFRSESGAGTLATDTTVDVVPFAGRVTVEVVQYQLMVRSAGGLVTVHTARSPSPAATSSLYSLGRSGADRGALVSVTIDGDAAVQAPMTDTWISLTGGVDDLGSLEARDFTEALDVLTEEPEVAMVAIPDVHATAAAPPDYAPVPFDERDRCRPPCPGTLPRPPARRSPAPATLRPLSPGAVMIVQRALVEHCEYLADRIAVLDPPPAGPDEVSARIDLDRWRHEFDSSFGVAYSPWVRPALVDAGLTPPSGFAAGVIAAAELARGVHRAPANVALTWASDLELRWGSDSHAWLNERGVNALTTRPGGSPRVMGARTCSSNSALVYLNVRRLLISIERQFRTSLNWAAFEPNDAVTRERVRLAIGSYLLALFADGALRGTTADQAFRVDCDPPADAELANGRLLARVFVAPTVPLEFIVLSVGVVRNELRVTTEKAPW